MVTTTGNGPRSSYTAQMLPEAIFRSRIACAAHSFSRLSWSTLHSSKQTDPAMAAETLAGWIELAYPRALEIFVGLKMLAAHWKSLHWNWV